MHTQQRMKKLPTVVVASLILSLGATTTTANAASVDGPVLAVLDSEGVTSVAGDDVLAALVTAPEESMDGYDRDLFPHWVTIQTDPDNCNTRTNVLRRDALGPLTYTQEGGCTVATGQWYSRYDAQHWTEASDVDIDHMVPLAEAWRSGAQHWVLDQRRAYANDIYPFYGSLVVMTDNLNQSKGDKDPSQWLPPEDVCHYVVTWIQVKYRWNLSVDNAERSALATELDECGNPNIELPQRADVPPPPGAVREFTDVPPTHPFFDEIGWLVSMAVTTGYDDGSFRPSAGVSRMAMAAFLYRFGKEPSFSVPSTPTFSDVPLTHPFFEEIEWLAAVGISTGYKDGTFRPSDSVSRQAMAAFLLRFRQTDPAPVTGSVFTDVPASHPFAEEIAWLVGSSITTGYDDGTFRPGATVSRQAMAAFLYRFYNAFGHFDPPSPPPPTSTPENPGDSKNCSDFDTWEEAQGWYDYYFPYYGDVANLDADDDGVVCESLPGAP